VKTDGSCSVLDSGQETDLDILSSIDQQLRVFSAAECSAQTTSTVDDLPPPENRDSRSLADRESLLRIR
jgi:hypothetical protein